MFRLYKNRIALEWARRNLPPQQYYEIETSYYSTIKYTTIFVICCIPIIFAFVFIVIFAPFSNKAEAASMPSGATTSRTARIDYYGNFYWTHDSRKYEDALENYGLNPDNYMPGDIIKIYIDDAQNVIKATDIEEGLSLREIEIIVGSIGAFVVPLFLILCIYLPIAFTTFSKPWRNFIRAYNKMW